MDATWPTFLFYLFLSTLCRAWAFSSKVFISYVFVAKKENTKNQPKYEITAILFGVCCNFSNDLLQPK